MARTVYRVLKIRGLGRIDVRLTPAGEVIVIEANPNPSLAKEDDFAAVGGDRWGSDYERAHPEDPGRGHGLTRARGRAGGRCQRIQDAVVAAEPDLRAGRDGGDAAASADAVGVARVVERDEARALGADQEAVAPACQRARVDVVGARLGEGQGGDRFVTDEDQAAVIGAGDGAVAHRHQRRDDVAARARRAEDERAPGRDLRREAACSRRRRLRACRQRGDRRQRRAR